MAYKGKKSEKLVYLQVNSIHLEGEFLNKPFKVKLEINKPDKKFCHYTFQDLFNSLMNGIFNLCKNAISSATSGQKISFPKGGELILRASYKGITKGQYSCNVCGAWKII